MRVYGTYLRYSSNIFIYNSCDRFFWPNCNISGAGETRFPCASNRPGDVASRRGQTS